MRSARLLLLLPIAGALGPAGCGTSAIGVEDCRNVEEARCKAARSCNFGIDTSSDEDACLRFARDNCLHGMVVQAPTTGAVTECVNAINAAGACANKKTKLDACAGVRPSAYATSTATVCDVIENPEQISACEFLTQQPKPAPTTTAPTDAGPG